MSEIDYLESVLNDLDDFSYEAEIEMGSGFDSWDLITEETTEVRSYKVEFGEEESFSFSVEYGLLDGFEGYAFSSDSESDENEYLEQMVLDRLPEEFEKLDDITLDDGEYFFQRAR